MGWGDGILLQEVDVPGVGRTDGEGLGAAPPPCPLQEASWSVSWAHPARPLDQLAREERWDRWGGGGGRAVRLRVPHGSFSRMEWGSVQGGRCRLKK